MIEAWGPKGSLVGMAKDTISKPSYYEDFYEDFARENAITIGSFKDFELENKSPLQLKENNNENS